MADGTWISHENLRQALVFRKLLGKGEEYAIRRETDKRDYEKNTRLHRFTREFALLALIKIYDPSPEEAEKDIRDFLNDLNENLEIIADVTLNGIGIVAAA